MLIQHLPHELYMKHSSNKTQELEPGSHICFLYETEDEHRDFITDSGILNKKVIGDVHLILYINICL